jgi:hypothetical protein
MLPKAMAWWEWPCKPAPNAAVHPVLDRKGVRTEELETAVRSSRRSQLPPGDDHGTDASR